MATVSPALLLLLWLASTSGWAAPSEPPLNRWIEEAGISPDELGIVVQPVTGGESLVGHNASRLFNPASTMKLLTTHAALATLGAGYRWHTDAFLRGTLSQGRLLGDLVLRGGGDPKLVIEDLAQFVAAMRSAGLNELQGDLVLDDSIFDVGPMSIEAFDGDPTQPYNVRPFGLLMNFKATRVVIHPQAGQPRISLDPQLDGVEIENRVRVRRGPCDRGGNWLTVSPLQQASAARLVVSGSYMPTCGEYGAFVSVFDHRAFIDALFRAVWRAAGGSWTGTTRIEPGAAQGEPWLQWRSPRTLTDVIQDINKFSNNVMARQLLLQIAHEAGARPATQQAGQQMLADWFRRQQIALPGLVIENGSGLSRAERISAEGMARVLLHAAASPHAELFRGSLPVLGIDGTMKYRMPGEPVVGRAWIKTGSLAQVRTIAGYVDAASGQRYALVVFYNGPQPSAVRGLQEKLLRWTYQNG